MKERSIQDWLNTAVAGIRFRPDREKVKEELRGHFEDKVADLERIFRLSHEEAQQMALRQMGDPEEIGREMAKIHRPWLGYLWLFSQMAVVLLAIMTVLVWYRSEDDDIKRAFIGWEYDQSKTASPWYWVRNDECDYVQVVELDVPEIEVGQYRVAARRAELWEYEGFENAPDGYRVVYLELDVDFDRPWEGPYDLQTYLWAEDDAGTYFLSRNEVCATKELILPMRDYVPGSGTEKNMEDGSDLDVYGTGFRPFSDTYQIILENVSLKAQKVTLYYDEMGAEFVLPITLEGEAETWEKS